jgi:phage-related holin
MKEFYIMLKDWSYLILVYLGIESGADVVKILFILMAFDTIVGILTALRLHEKISLNVLKWGIIIKLCFLLIPMTLALMAKAIDKDFSIFLISVMWVLIGNEGISIMRNIISIKTKKKIESTDYVTKLLMIIKNGLKEAIEKLLKIIEIQKGR